MEYEFEEEIVQRGFEERMYKKTVKHIN